MSIHIFPLFNKQNSGAGYMFLCVFFLLVLFPLHQTTFSIHLLSFAVGLLVFLKADFSDFE